MSGTRKLGSGRSGTTDTRGPEAGRAAALTLATFLPAAATRMGAGFAVPARWAASQRARSVCPMPLHRENRERERRPDARHSAGAQRRTMSSADLRPKSR